MSFRFKGVPVYLSFPLAASLCVVLTVDTSLTAFCAIINAVLHELGHILTLHRFGCKIKCINLSLFDINIKKTDCALSINNEIAVALSGPAANILCSLIFGLLYCFTNIKLLLTLSFSALFLACFNLLPVETLDGGSALMLLLIKRLSGETALKILRVVSCAVLIPMLVFGIALLLKSKYNFTLLFTSCYLIGIILLRQKQEE